MNVISRNRLIFARANPRVDLVAQTELAQHTCQTAQAASNLRARLLVLISVAAEQAAQQATQTALLLLTAAQQAAKHAAQATLLLLTAAQQTAEHTAQTALLLLAAAVGHHADNRLQQCALYATAAVTTKTTAVATETATAWIEATALW